MLCAGLLGRRGRRDALGDAPVEDVIVLETLADEQVAEEFAEVRVVRLVVEAEGATIVKEDAKLIREATAKQVGGRGHLLLHDAVILLLLGRSLETLPRELTAEEVHENVGERFEIVTTRLFC